MKGIPMRRGLRLPQRLGCDLQNNVVEAMWTAELAGEIRERTTIA